MSAEGGPLELILLDPANEPRSPISPNQRPILLASMVVALIAAVFAALAADRIMQAFDTRHAVRERLGTTILGEIPKFTRSARKFPIISLFTDREAQSNEIISAFETVRINAEFRLMDQSDPTISVISLDRHAGKTTVAAGLSCALSKVGRHVVAVEADLRRPTLAEQLGTGRGHGLGDLSASGSEGISLQSTGYSSLEVLTAGLPVGRAADVIGSTLPRVLNELATDGRTIVVDAPPLRGAPESSIVVAQTHHVILVVSNDQTDLDTLSDAVARINEAGGVLLGIVINRVPRRKLRRDAYPEFSERRNLRAVRSPAARGPVMVRQRHRRSPDDAGSPDTDDRLDESAWSHEVAVHSRHAKQPARSATFAALPDRLQPDSLIRALRSGRQVGVSPPRSGGHTRDRHTGEQCGAGNHQRRGDIGVARARQGAGLLATDGASGAAGPDTTIDVVVVVVGRCSSVAGG